MNKLKFVRLLALVGIIFSLVITTSTVVLADWAPGDGHKMHFPQLPDTAGWDVNATATLVPPVVLADDWMCSETGWVKDIHFWGSWLEGFEGVIDSFALSIHANIPADPDTPYSRPGETLWEWEVPFDSVAVIGPITSSTWEGWYDPSSGNYSPSDHNTYFQYNVFLPEAEWFWQDSGTVYWLNISAFVADLPGGNWGWKSSRDHWQDDACWALWGELNWVDIWEPPDFIQSLDLAFVITGDTLGPVEDLDFGDCPDPNYPTLLASNGARHTIVPGVFLGANIDAEPDGQPSADALGDDNNPFGGPDDEDGVVFTSLVIQGQPATVKVTASVAGFLDAWVDFNADGDWADAGEQIFNTTPLVAGVNHLTFNVPAGAATGITYSRFRFSTAGGLSYTGQASDGEVEDYRVFILHPVENIKMHWPQLPDLDNTGMDVDMYAAPLADDWMCTQTGAVTDIHFWGSFADDILPADGVGSLTFRVSILSNIPAGGAAEWSMPGDTLWTRVFAPGQYQVYQIADNNPEDWYDPATGLWLNDNHLQVYQYEFYIDEDPFVQDSGMIYWLSVDETAHPSDYTFGWKTTPYDLHFMDDATFWQPDLPPFWFPMYYPDGHEWAGTTLDLAFVITGEPVGPEEIMINEFVPKGTEWIELYNYGATDVNLNGWALTDGEGTDNLSGIIHAGEHLSFGTTNINLSNDGDDIYLINPFGATVDQVIYGNMGGAPIAPTGCSVARAPDGSDTDDDARDWTIDRDPTQDAANDAPAPQLGSSLIINEIDPYPSANGDSLELYNPTGSAVDITDWWFTDGDDIIDLASGGTVPAGGWLVLAEGSGDWPNGQCDFASKDVAYLFNADSVRVDQLGWYGEYNDHSFQRCPDAAGPNDGYDWTSSGGGATLFDTASTWGSANCVACEPPQPPTNLLCVATDTCIVLTWTNTSEYDSVAVYRSWGGVSETLLVILPDSPESYHDSTCGCTGNYDYHVTGFHCDEESGPSNTCWVYKLGEVQYSWDFNESDQGWMHYPDPPIPPNQDSWQWGPAAWPHVPGEPTCPVAGVGDPVPLTNYWGTIIGGPYLPFSCCRLYSPPVQLDTCTALLEICHWYAMIPDPPDGGNVKVSTDDGANWELITPCQDYPFILLDTECDKTIGRPGYSGASSGWVLDYFDLAALGYGGRTVQIAFDFGSNDNPDEWPGWYIKWAKIYHCPPVGVEEKHGALELPTTFALAQNYPNPFNLRTAIRYQIPQDCRVTLEIYNLLGQKVRTLVSGEQKANYYTTYWDGKDAEGKEISSGIYFYKLQAGSFTQTRKLVILK